jgi:hypothetical protein
MEINTLISFPLLALIGAFSYMFITELRIRGFMLKNKLELEKMKMFQYKERVEDRVNFLELCVTALKISIMVYEEREDYENAQKCLKFLKKKLNNKREVRVL